LVTKSEECMACVLLLSTMFHVMATTVTKIRKSFEVLFSKIIWSSNMEEVLETSSFISTHMNEKLINKVLIECSSVHRKPH
jgi:hypothetical protein